jgi:MFS superfamily sulfate permease-like transporter
MRRIRAVRKLEWAVALITAVAVVVLGVEYGIVLAIIASIVDHLRHSYFPLNSVLVKSPEGHWKPVPPRPGTRTEEGLVVYRFDTSLYYANASRLLEDITGLVAHGGPLHWLVIDCAAIGDVDYTASSVLAKGVELVQEHRVHVAFSSVLGPVRQQLDSYGISKTLGQDAYFDTPGEALDGFHSAVR